MKTTVQIFLFILILTTTLSATTFYVATTGSNSNAGTSAAPFLTIQHGVNQLTPDDDLIVRAGTYTDKVLISTLFGTSTDPVNIMADGTVIIDGTSVVPFSRQGLITIRNSSYINLDGFEMRNFSTSGGGPTPMGILIDGSGTNINITNNKVHDIKNTSTCTGCAEGAHGIGVFGTTSTGLRNILLSGNEVYDNVLQSSEAFVINGNVDGFYVINNNVHDNNNIGFDFIGHEDECSICGDEDDRARNGIVRGNTSKNNSTIGNPWYPTLDGSAGGFYVDGGRYILFDGNRSEGNDIGFEFASEMPGKKTEDVLAINNVVLNNKEVGMIMGGYASSTAGPGGGSAERIYLYNNSTYHNKGWGTEIVFQYRVIDCGIANNIFYGEASIGENFEELGTGNTGNTWGKNLWWGASTTGGGTLPGTTLFGNPFYTNAGAGDLSILDFSPAIELGISQSNITTWPSTFWGAMVHAHGEADHGGNIRVENVIDIGADELNSTNNGSITLATDCINVNYNSFSDRIIVDGVFTDFTIKVLNSSEQAVQDLSGSSSPLTIDLLGLDGQHFLLIENSANTNVDFQDMIKE